MIEALTDMLPVAMAVALSPFPIIAIVLILGTASGIAAGAAFSLGWVVGLATLSALLLLVGDGAAAGAFGGWLQLLVALLLFWGAWRKWRGRPKRGAPPKVPAWIAALDRISVGRSALVGAGLGGLNPKNIALGFAAIAPIAYRAPTVAQAALAVLAFTLLGSITVLGALAVRAFGGSRSAAQLEAVKQFMLANNHVIMMIIYLLIGTKLLGDALATLTG